MGQYITKFFAKFFTECKGRILLLGLDGAGKTTILYKMKMDEVVDTIPTIGFNVEQLKYKNIEMTIWDIGGQDRIRALWRYYYPNTDAIIFVVDSNDKDRIDEARLEIQKLLSEDLLKDAVLLVFANKQDIPQAMSAKELSQSLDLPRMHRKWFLQPCSATTGVGIIEGFEWLSTTLKNKASSK